MNTISSDREIRVALDRVDATQAGYFVARAAIAALRPLGQLPGGSAWQAAMSARMAQTSKPIVSGDSGSGPESEQQYAILSAYMNA